MSANPMLFADDLRNAKQQADLESERTQAMREELEKIRVMNQSLVDEVNEAKKREATAKLSHFHASGSSSKLESRNKKRTKKKKAFNDRPKEVELGDMGERSDAMGERSKSKLKQVADKLGISNEMRRAKSNKHAEAEGTETSKGEFDL
jgi:hypothetical protein